MPEKKEDVSVFAGEETILVVDDEARILDLTKRTLEHYGYNVLTAGDGKEAVAIFKKKSAGIDLVILDVLMPKMGGSEAGEKMKKIDPAVKILISTGYIDSEPTKELMNSGEHKVVEKPFHIQELLYAIRAILNNDKK